MRPIAKMSARMAKAYKAAAKIMQAGVRRVAIILDDEYDVFFKSAGRGRFRVVESEHVQRLGDWPQITADSDIVVVWENGETVEEAVF